MDVDFITNLAININQLLKQLFKSDTNFKTSPNNYDCHVNFLRLPTQRAN